jgi:hypothetical protein
MNGQQETGNKSVGVKREKWNSLLFPMQLLCGGRCHGKRLHQQTVVVALIVENLMRIVWSHVYTKIKQIQGYFKV